MRCPTCNIIYPNDKHKFCLDDGALLIENAQSNSQAETLQFNEKSKPALAVLEIPLPNADDTVLVMNFSLKLSPTAVIVGIYMRLLDSAVSARWPHLCAVISDNITAPRYFRIVTAEQSVDGQYVGSFSTKKDDYSLTDDLLLHLFEVERLSEGQEVAGRD